MGVLITGATGLIGSALSARLESEGAEVSQLTRHSVDEADEKSIYWHPESGTLDGEKIEGFRYVVHLAGENIAGERWTEEKKRRIYDSRITSTTLLCRILANLKAKPKMLICASAIGYYGNRGEEELTEASEPGEGFLAEVCRAWEEACTPAADAGIRVTNLRIGVVLTSKGGALQKMQKQFRLGLGGPVGGGQQWMSWITLDDLTGIILHCINNRRMTGAVNAVSPNPVQNLEFVQALGEAMGKRASLAVPAVAIKLALGEMGRELVLSSARVVPERLKEFGFEWHYPDINEALQACVSGEI